LSSRRLSFQEIFTAVEVVRFFIAVGMVVILNRGRAGNRIRLAALQHFLDEAPILGGPSYLPPNHGYSQQVGSQHVGWIFQKPNECRFRQVRL